MPMRLIRTVYVTGMLALLVAVGLWNRPSMAWAESAPDGKSEAPPVQRSKDLDVKPKEPELKSKEPDSKPTEQKSKEADSKPKDAEPKAKESDPKAKDPEPKTKDPESKAKEPAAKIKESEHKGKEVESKTKEPESKAKDADVPVEHPCPTVPHATDVKPAAEAQTPSSEPGGGDRLKAAEPETKPEVKKPIRSSMVTAKLALMADPHLFPYDIEVDAKDKDLVLLGKVSQESDRRVATDIVRCLEGVHAVENRLKIEPDAAHGLVAERDKLITQLVKERFEKSKTLQSVKFDVKTEDGIVILNGATRFQIIVLEAAQAARQVPGVRAVNSDAVRLVAGE